MSRLMQDLQHSPQLARLAETSRAPVTFYLDGAPVQALTGDTVLTAILMHQRHVRISEFSGAPRAGFCLIGACQDCWVRCESDSAEAAGVTDTARGHAVQQPLTRLRACSTLVRPGMRIVTNAGDAGNAAPGGQA
ncbi:Hydrogen cyanide synthase subunit HcnA [Pandoraea iniqua]|uniref:Hydrogen cyanide synthase subunit HcnA n=1 Tax=Pandoraea iniqua TaxID=2508288 RepID=A0A5E4VNM4_9BURK|nr:(2Fe-2S)-binding protein [Pandoraea iniqua]VVE12605.1 Hydrogen cyanide synthase subunit HcnA [Pandoraea iniqua]VVE20759.1 Hydrogen cyanide synthase subunit HcnA [Pandoraea iniqua]